MKLFGKKLSGSLDFYEVKVHEDGRADEPCWFCGGTVVVPKEGAGDVSTVTIEALGGDGRTRGVCHTTCAERARGSLSV